MIYIFKAVPGRSQPCTRRVDVNVWLVNVLGRTSIQKSEDRRMFLRRSTILTMLQFGAMKFDRGASVYKSESLRVELGA